MAGITCLRLISFTNMILNTTTRCWFLNWQIHPGLRQQDGNDLVMLNALTIDIEDYFMVSAFADMVKFEDWLQYESRIEMNTSRLLDILDEHGVKATFFILGWVAENYPELVQKIHRSGHEIACHGYNHRLAYELSLKEFREDTRKSKAVIEDAIGEAVLGYRAASYSIIKSSLWTLDILIEEGFAYDSSIFPIYHDLYGYQEFSRFPVKIFRKDVGEILEVPLSTVRLLERNVPIAGGGYFRLFPIQFIEWGIRRLNEKELQPAIIYLHPWELDPEQPRLNGRRLSSFRHYIKLETTSAKLHRLLRTFRFGPISKVFYISRIRQNETESAIHSIWLL